MRLVREAEITILASPDTAELGSPGRVLCAASGLFECDFSGRVTRTFRKPSGYGIRGFEITRGGLVAQTASAFRVYDLRTGKEKSDFTPKGVHWFTGASRDGRLVLTTVDNKSLSVWDLKKKALLVSHTEKKSFVAAAAISPDGTVVAHGGTDGIVRFFDVASGQPSARVASKGWIEAVVAFDGGFVTGGRAGIVSVWRGTELERTLAFGGKIAPCGLAVSRDGRLVAAHGSHGAPKLWDAGAKSAIEIDHHHGAGLLGGTRSVRFSADGLRVVTAGNDCRVVVSKIEL